MNESKHVSSNRTKLLSCLAILASAFATICIPSSSGVSAKPGIAKLTPQVISLKTLKLDFEPKHPNKEKFGKLLWRGGIALFSENRLFGGLSGLTINASGEKIYAVSDSGFWLTANLKHEGATLKSVENVRIGPVVKPAKTTKAMEYNVDAEGIALQTPTNNRSPLVVSFERNHRIKHYIQEKQQLTATKKTLKLHKKVGKAGRNKGLEAIEYIRSGPHKGSIIAFAERLKDKRGNLKGWIFGRKKTKKITIKRKDGFDITGLATLPEGDLFVLERRFRFDEGVKMRIRRVKAKDIKPKALLVGETLLQTSNAKNSIDNMEGIAVHRTKNGEIIITLISDDNFNFFQRTLLMQFALAGSEQRRAAKQ